MNKNSLASITAQLQLKRSQSQMLRHNNYQQQQFFITHNKNQNKMTFNSSNKIIKITQFNSGLVLQERKTVPVSHNLQNHLNPPTPIKHFTLKKSKEHHLREPINSQSLVEIQLKKKERQFRSYKPNRQQREDANRSTKPPKVLITSKWKFKNQILDLQFLTNQVNNSQSVVVVRPLQVDNKKDANDKAILGYKKEFATQKDFSKTASCRDRVKAKGNLDIDLQDKDETLMRRISVSPRKRYNQHLQQQKRYQENIEKEKRQLLQIRKQVNKNYAKPFNPPENVSASAYCLFEADCKKKTTKMRKYSALRKQDQEGFSQMRKLFLHSHKVLASSNSRTAMEMASLTKIMTCIVAIQISNNLGLKLSKQEVSVGIFEQNIGGTSANIKKGQIYTIIQLLHGLMLPSGNDASLAIAVWGGKSLLKKQSEPNAPSPRKWRKRQCYDRFLAQMNNKASQLNMQKTKYCNSHGLCNTQNKSCCFDLCILCEYAMNNELFRKIVSCRQYECQIKIETEGVQLYKSTQKDGQMRDSRKWIKKKISQGFPSQKNMQLEELKDMDQIPEDYPVDEQQPQTFYQKIIMTKTVRWQNTHQLLQNKPELYIGIKTGVTTTAGPCLASCLQINKRRFIIIVLNCKSMKHRMKDTQILRKWLFQKEGIKIDENKQQKMQNEDLQ